MAKRLLAETRRMQGANDQLEQKLQASREDISQLQRDLDDVRHEAMLDPLTKIYNRKFFDDGLIKALNEAKSRSAPLSLMLLDIDHFKLYNDQGTRPATRCCGWWRHAEIEHQGQARRRPLRGEFARSCRTPISKVRCGWRRTSAGRCRPRSC